MNSISHLYFLPLFFARFSESTDDIKVPYITKIYESKELNAIVNILLSITAKNNIAILTRSYRQYVHVMLFNVPEITLCSSFITMPYLSTTSVVILC